MPSANIRNGKYVVNSYETLQNDPQFGGADKIRSIFSGAANDPMDTAPGNPFSAGNLVKNFLVPQSLKDGVKSKWNETVDKHQSLQKLTEAKNNLKSQYNKITDSAIKTDMNLGQKIIDRADKINVGAFKENLPTDTVGKKFSNAASNVVNSAKGTIKDGTKSLFTDNVNLKSNIPGATAAHTQTVNVSYPALSAPVNKAKNIVKPIATTMAIMYGAKKLNEILDRRAEQKKEERKFNRERMQKSASYDSQEKLRASNKTLKKIAMTTIAYSDKMISSQRAEIEKLASENCILKLDSMAEIRYKVASELSGEMLEKGLIPPSDYSKTLEDIMSMDDESYEKFASLLKKVQKVGVNPSENLTSDVFNFNIKEESPVTTAYHGNMEDAIINL